MACLVQRRVVNPRYKKISPDNHFYLFHEGYFSTPPRPRDDYYIDVPCGRCYNCVRKYLSSWRFRLLQEFRYLSSAARSRSFFITLTIEPKFYDERKAVLSKMVRRFLERIRRKTKKSVRHFLITERGDSKQGEHRIHFHGFLIDCHFDPSLLWSFWQYGFVTISPLHDQKYTLSQRISYCTSYMLKGKYHLDNFIFNPEDVPIVFVSPGLGRAYADYNKSFHHQNGLLYPLAVDTSGFTRSLPRYLRLKVFNDDEREIMKKEYFSSIDVDVIPEPPYFVGNRQFDDYTLYLNYISLIKKTYYKKYVK